MNFKKNGAFNTNTSFKKLKIFIFLYALNISQSYSQTTANSTDIIKANNTISEEIKKTANSIDNSITPTTPNTFLKNKSSAHITLGYDLSELDSDKIFLKYGLQLHLPRFQEYWKLKFENKDKKRERGVIPMSKSIRTQNNSEDIFLGLSFQKYLNDVQLEYEPKIAFKNGFGLDHSIQAISTASYKNIFISPSVELFANHDEGSGASGSLDFKYNISNKIVLFESNHTRYLFLVHNLKITHLLGIHYFSTDEISYKTDYFRGYGNNYQLASYGHSFSFIYSLIKNILFTDLTPYLIHERDNDFKENYGFTFSFRMNFNKN